MMRLRVPALMAMCAVLITALPGASASVRTSASAQPNAVPAALLPFYQQSLQWEPCRKVLQCASFAVPLDYSQPSGDSITIVAARALALGKSRGALVINPGGPGGSGIEYISDPNQAVSAAARRNFDLVSFDPRGVGQSEALWCLRGRDLDAFLDLDPTPDTAAERASIVTAGRDLAAACEREDAKLMPHLSAVDIARDMDVLRSLLGESRLRYVGKSWGTVLGKVYAALFPQRVGSFVYDGAVDLSLTPQQAAFDQGLGFETAAERFAAWCARRPVCPLGKTREEIMKRLVSFVQSLDAQPLPTDDPKRPLTEAQAIIAILGPLYVSDGGWSWLLTGLAPALELRSGRPLQTIFDWFMERNENGSYANNANTAIYAMNCLDDRPAVSTIAQAQALADTWRKRLPLMGATMAWSELPCATWPFRASTDIAKLRVRNVPPSLVIGGAYDPATPLKWSRAVAKQLPGAVLLVRRGDGHTSYGNGVPCVDAKVDAFLSSRDVWRPVLPRKGTVCAASAS